MTKTAGTESVPAIFVMHDHAAVDCTRCLGRFGYGSVGK